jgi:hypothetical protein
MCGSYPEMGPPRVAKPRPGLDRRQRALVVVAAFTALKLEAQAAKFGQSALNVGLSRTEIIEAVIQTPASSLRPRQFAAVRAEPETRDEEPGHSAHVLSGGFYSPISYCERLIESRQAEPLPRHDFVVRF